MDDGQQFAAVVPGRVVGEVVTDFAHGEVQLRLRRNIGSLHDEATVVPAMNCGKIIYTGKHSYPRELGK